MNRSPLSLIGQMGTRSVRRFSYCLPRFDSAIKSSFVRFGNDVPQRGNFQKTSFLRETNDYRIKLQGISIGGRVVTLPKTAFSKGCVLDTGSAASRLEMAAYTPLLLSLQMYFNGFNLRRLRSDPRSEGDMCYRLQPGFKNYPSMTLHFEGANLQIPPENLFYFTDDRFCLTLFGTPDLTILGAYQQQNVRFIYDVSNDKLLFSKEDCSKDRA